jgi:hypothetical protein
MARSAIFVVAATLMVATNPAASPAAETLESVRNICSKNPNCRVVRDDSQITAFCTGDNCIAAKKGGKKGSQGTEFLRVKMTDVMITRTVTGRPVSTSAGIIAILIGGPSSTAAAPSSKPPEQRGSAPANLLNDRAGAPVSTGTGAGGTRTKVPRQDLVPMTSPGGPTIQAR